MSTHLCEVSNTDSDTNSGLLLTLLLVLRRQSTVTVIITTHKKHNCRKSFQSSVLETIASPLAGVIRNFATRTTPFKASKAVGTSQEKAQTTIVVNPTKILKVNRRVIITIHFKTAAIATMVVLVPLPITHTS